MAYLRRYRPLRHDASGLLPGADDVDKVVTVSPGDNLNDALATINANGSKNLLFPAIKKIPFPMSCDVFVMNY